MTEAESPVIFYLWACLFSANLIVKQGEIYLLGGAMLTKRGKMLFF